MTAKIPFTVIVDTREQNPFDLAPLVSESGTLCTGDYSIKGLEKFIRIERKSIPDLIQCIGRERDRFEREITRLKGFHHKAILVEGSYDDIYAQNWRGQITTKQVLGSISRWQLDGVPVILPGARDRSCKILQNMLYLCAKQYYNINKCFMEKAG